MGMNTRMFEDEFRASVGCMESVHLYTHGACVRACACACVYVDAYQILWRRRQSVHHRRSPPTISRTADAKACMSANAARENVRPHVCECVQYAHV